MEDFSEEGKIVGLILDVSLRHDENGRRILDGIKDSMMRVVLDFLEDDVDQVYLFHPDLTESLVNHGDQLSAISNYETDGWDFDLNYAVKKTLYVTAAHGAHCRKYIFCVTDKLRNKNALDKLIRLNEKDLIDAKLVLIGVGDHYDKKLCELIQGSNFIYFHVDHPSTLVSQIFKEPRNGQRQDFHSTTDEQCERV